MKKIALLPLFISLLSLVSAHTGNDLYDHHMTVSDGIFGGILATLIIIILVLFIIWLIKQIQKK